MPNTIKEIEDAKEMHSYAELYRTFGRVYREPEKYPMALGYSNLKIDKFESAA